VLLDLESARHLGIDSARATADVEHAIAGAAAKMVVMVLVRRLVTCGLSGNLDGRQEAFFDHRLEVSIDRGDSQAGYFHLRRIQDVLHAQRAARPLDGSADRAPLSGLSERWPRQARLFPVALLRALAGRSRVSLDGGRRLRSHAEISHQVERGLARCPLETVESN